MKRALSPRVGSVVLVLLAACATRAERDQGFPLLAPDLPNEPSLSVLVLGDWGTGGEGQRAIAQAMARTHADDPPDFVITVGDNFYPRGVQDLEDPLWQEVFADVYRGGFWDSVPIHPSLGNHDHDGVPEVQIEYSAVDPRWQMPDFYYTIDRMVDRVGAVRFVAIDTDPIDGEDDGFERQVEWLDQVLDANTAWTIVYGHHPLSSSGVHGPSDDVLDNTVALMRGRADLYLAGHDHITEVAQVGQGLTTAICGGGGGEDNDLPVQPAFDSYFAFSTGGWCVLRIFRGVLAVDLHDASGALRYRHLIRPREQAKPRVGGRIGWN